MFVFLFLTNVLPLIIVEFALVVIRDIISRMEVVSLLQLFRSLMLDVHLGTGTNKYVYNAQITLSLTVIMFVFLFLTNVQPLITLEHASLAIKDTISRMESAH